MATGTVRKRCGTSEGSGRFRQLCNQQHVVEEEHLTLMLAGLRGLLVDVDDLVQSTEADQTPVRGQAEVRHLLSTVLGGEIGLVFVDEFLLIETFNLKVSS